MPTILLVDDDPDVGTLMVKLLNKQGYDVDTVLSRGEAITKLEAALPSVILLDVLLSGTDGRELCREIKENERTRCIPVIMLSAHPGAAYNFESYGADDFVAKPINAEELLQKLSSQLMNVK